MKRFLLMLGWMIFVASSLAELPANPPAHSSRATNAPSIRTPSPSWQRYSLRIEKALQLNAPGGKPFEASGLLWTREGKLLTLDNSGPGVYRIHLPKGGWHSADLELLPNLFAHPQVTAVMKGKLAGNGDFEGIAEDAEGRIYLCEEASRTILRTDPKTKAVECLNIDWSRVRKYFSTIDGNASFEGIAIGKGRLYIANERARGRIIVVDLALSMVIDDFAVRPRGSSARDLDYSDLCWFEDALWILLREGRCVLKVDPRTVQVLCEYDFREVEDNPEFTYSKKYPTGVMEGLAVDRDYIWLVTDNNNLGRRRFPRDARPTLFRCLRPDRPAGMTQ